MNFLHDKLINRRAYLRYEIMNLLELYSERDKLLNKINTQILKTDARNLNKLENLEFIKTEIKFKYDMLIMSLYLIEYLNKREKLRTVEN